MQVSLCTQKVQLLKFSVHHKVENYYTLSVSIQNIKMSVYEM